MAQETTWYSLNKQQWPSPKCMRWTTSTNLITPLFQVKLSSNDLFNLDKPLFSSSKADWKGIEIKIHQKPLNPYCYSNVDVVVDLWYNNLYKKLVMKNSQKKNKTSRQSTTLDLKRGANVNRRQNTQIKQT